MHSDTGRADMLMILITMKVDSLIGLHEQYLANSLFIINLQLLFSKFLLKLCNVTLNL